MSGMLSSENILSFAISSFSNENHNCRFSKVCCQTTLELIISDHDINAHKWQTNNVDNLFTYLVLEGLRVCLSVWLRFNVLITAEWNLHRAVVEASVLIYSCLIKIIDEIFPLFAERISLCFTTAISVRASLH